MVPGLAESQSSVLQLPTFVRELLAGGVAGGLGKTCVAPLERTKILFQTGQVHGQTVWWTLVLLGQREGVPGLFRGNGASVLRIVPYAAVHFGAYEYYRQALVDLLLGPADDPHRRVSPVLDLVAGSSAGATAVLLTYPLDLVRTRLAYEVQPGVQGAARPTRMEAAVPHRARAQSSMGASTSYFTQNARHMQRSTIPSVLRSTIQAEGFAGLYRGIGPTLCGILPYAGLKFYVYQSLKQQYRSWVVAGRMGLEEEVPQRLPVPLMLTFGACAGLVAQTATYPLDVVRRQMQVQSLRQPSVPIVSTWHGLQTIAAKQGWRGLFTGLSINYMKVVPSTAIGFTIYDAMKAWLLLPNHL